MSQAIMNRKPAPASLRRPKPARTVLLRMAADESRAKRLRELKAEFPDVKWPQLARYCGVSDRSVAQWAATGAISYPNAKKAAQFFQEHGADIDDDFVWRGLREATPNLMDMRGSDPPHENLIEALLRQILTRLDALDALGDRLAGLEEQARRTQADVELLLGEERRRTEAAVRARTDRPQQEPPS